MHYLFMNPLFLNKIGGMEILIILVLFLLLFGGKKIPELMRGLGRGVREFKDAMDKPAGQSDDKAEKPASDNAEKPEEKK